MMKDLRDKVAFVTGGASGLGLGMAKAFGREGMRVMIADIEQAALSKAVQELRTAKCGPKACCATSGRARRSGRPR